MSIKVFGFDNDANIETPREPLPKLSGNSVTPLSSPKKDSVGDSGGMMNKLEVSRMDTGVNQPPQAANVNNTPAENGKSAGKNQNKKNKKGKNEDCNVF